MRYCATTSLKDGGARDRGLNPLQLGDKINLDPYKFMAWEMAQSENHLPGVHENLTSLSGRHVKTPRHCGLPIFLVLEGQRKVGLTGQPAWPTQTAPNH